MSIFTLHFPTGVIWRWLEIETREEEQQLTISWIWPPNDLFFLVKFSWRIWIQFLNWELHWLLNEHHPYLLWSVVVELSRMPAKLVTLVAPRSWKIPVLPGSSYHIGGPYAHQALQLLKGETILLKVDIFFCHHFLANDYEEGASLRGASVQALLRSGL